MASVHTLISASQVAPEALAAQTQQRLLLWENWLQPVTAEQPTGDDPGYDDDFQLMREEVNKLSGANTDLICQLAEKLLTTVTQDIRVASYYAWARLHRDGEAGLADGLELLAGLMQRFGVSLHPQRDRSRRAALDWLASQRMLDSLSLYPEVCNSDALRITGALLIMEQTQEGAVPGALCAALETRLMKSGGPEAVVPQNISDAPLAAVGGQRASAQRYHLWSGAADAGAGAGKVSQRPAGWLALCPSPDKEHSP